MGAGAATMKGTLDEEVKKPIDATDVDTPRGVSAKEEVKRLRGILYKLKEDHEKSDGKGGVPSLEDYLKNAFLKHDSDNNGTLSTEEFWKLMKELQLGLSDADIEWLHSVTDADADNSVKLDEFIAAAPNYFMQLASTYGPSNARDWCELQDDDGNIYYYNKRTGESSWEPPNGWFQDVGRDPPTLVEYLQSVCQQGGEEEASKELSEEDFGKILEERLKLNLSEENLAEVKAKYKEKCNGKFVLNEFAAVGAELIQALFADKEENECWVQVPSTYYSMNLKTGVGAWLSQ